MINYYEQKENMNKNLVLIAKPQFSCQGKGIFLVKNMRSLDKDQNLVIQEYIANPFLISNAFTR
jgi:tubulin polyglutamylase TTLL6/13